MLFVSGCEDEILNKEPKDAFTETAVWEDVNLAEKFILSIYLGLGYPWAGVKPWQGGTVILLDGLTDIAHGNADINGEWSFEQGNISPEFLGPFRNVWNRKYDFIRKANIALDHIDELPLEEEEKNIFKGEVKFLRARMYFDLINRWGGVPLITRVFEMDEDFTETRNNYEEIVDWIVNELDEAKNMVPNQWVDSYWGRVTKGACVALKSNVLLYANSKLHDPNTEPSGPLFDYTKDTWQEVAEAAKEVIDMPEYVLQEVDNPQDYHNIFLHPNDEMIFVQGYHNEYGIFRFHILWALAPMAWGGVNYTMPSHNLVNSFQMANGMMIDEPGSGYNPSPDSIFVNRELRFYANIYHQGSTYSGEEMNFYLPGGNMSKDGIKGGSAPQAGYTIRKLIDPTQEVGKVYGDTPWVWMRLAEMYLNYAEAQYMMGNEAEAIMYINIIRNRVKLPDITSSGNQLFKDIQHERKIELCFENHRFFDVRRWMIADETDNEDVMLLSWEKLDQNGELDPDGELTYETLVHERSFYSRMYYLPIPVEEINKSGLQQNPEYFSGN
jgi:hypothetical protein